MRYHRGMLYLLAAALLLAAPAIAQEDIALHRSVLLQDSLLFDEGFNKCDTGRFGQLISDDFEFYHDQAGETRTKQAFIDGVRKGLCNLPYRAVRIPERKSAELFPMYRGDSLYAAIQQGFHRFYADVPGKPRRFTSRARFTHLWKLEQGQWRLSRALSFDHQEEAADEAPDLDDSVQVAAWLRQHKVPALSIGIVRGGQLLQIRTYGEIRSGVPATRDALFNVASITKTMTAMLVLRLVSGGHWDLDEPLVRYWTDPDLAADPRSRLITTRHILNQQSGFPNWRRELPGKRLAFLATPGTQYRYSGEGFEYLRRALERRFGKPLDRLADSLLLRPLGMHNTHFVWNANIDSSLVAIPHDAAGRAAPHERNEQPNAADLVLTTIPDLSAFLISVLNGTGLNAELAAEMMRPAVETKPRRSVGLCWFIYAPLGQGELALSHGGDDPGMHSICFLLPKTREGLIIFSNSDNAPGLYAGLLRALLKDRGEDIIRIEME